LKKKFVFHMMFLIRKLVSNLQQTNNISLI
jgi:hypothetical protein